MKRVIGRKAVYIGITILLIIAFVSTWRIERKGSSGTGTIIDSASVAIAVPASANIEKQQDIETTRRNAITRAVENVCPAVVSVTTTAVQTGYVPLDPFGMFLQPTQQVVEGIGSGFIISEDGYIVTNEHVIQGAEKVTITMTNGKKYEADVVESDVEHDVSLLKIEEKNLPTVKIGNSDDIIIGEWAIAIGNPFGLFEINNKPSVTVGVISATQRDFGANIERGKSYQGMIQTDASINTGNSGGPLVNSLGEVIGVNTFILTAEQGSQGSVGIGFAIPINMVINLIPELKEKAKRAFWVGITSGINLNRFIAAQYNLRTAEGFLVAEVEQSSPAEKAGIRKMDVIVLVNGKKVQTYNDITKYINESDPRPGKEIKITVMRNNRLYEATVTLEAPPKRQK